MAGMTRAAMREAADAGRVVFEIDGRVYDCTAFAAEHPGGGAALEAVAGRSATDSFEEAEHSAEARRAMAAYLVGDLLPDAEAPAAPAGPPERVLVLYGGAPRGLCQQLAARLERAAAGGAAAVDVRSMKDADPEDLARERFVVLVAATYEGGAPAPDAAYFFQWLREAQHDHRVVAGFLGGVHTAVFGVGNSLYEEHYNAAGRELERLLAGLGARPALERGEGDCSTSRKASGTVESDWADWSARCLLAIDRVRAGAAGAADYEFVGEDAEAEEQAAGVLDVEDMNLAVPGGVPAAGAGAGAASSSSAEAAPAEDGGVVVQKRGRRKARAEAKRREEEAAAAAAAEAEEEAEDDATKPNPEPREMLQPHVRKNLEKQGYKLIGSHSAVKLCRWTKAMLRGRGGCYKNNAYGIVSYQCMEMTPSMSCANKCTFCWRAGTNPVATAWVYKTDSPEALIEGAVKKHVAMIKEMKGVPGVKPDRFRDAFTPKHCALSLVGEPIMYPHINKFVRLLHDQGISSFLVTNATFPDAMRAMGPCTQLYVSIDAPTKEALKVVDRPLFKDFWERLIETLEALREKKQRTVYRLTLVKEFNMDEIEAYARLVAIGRPTFIEIKSVTWNATSELRMENVPFHHETRRFALELCKHLDGYEIACEHVHTCFVLIADTRLKVNGRWHTWIDYPRFHELVQEYYRTGAEFTTLDYMAETPSWALYGAEEEGFNPSETRVYRGKKTKEERDTARNAAMARQGVEPDTRE